MVTRRPPTEGLEFRWPWRPYQLRLLESVERHLDDDRLHIVAAPGAGKTTLGLELFRRLGRPALVLAPTLTIRRQWLLRLDDFLPRDDPDASASLESWTSMELRSPAFLTVATYQAVLARHRADAEAADEAPTDNDVSTLVDTLRRAEVGTLILDEAHHLKRAWWRALQRVVEALDGVTLLSLTGTPPYDATGLEWRRYEELCGPIDDEISVPELVKAKTLCAHQDFVYAVAPRDDEASEVRGHDDAVRETLAELVEDARLQVEVDQHPWVVGETPDLEEVLESPELAVALLVYLRATGAGLPPALLAGLALGGDEIPFLDRRWWQVLLKEYLFGDSFAADEEYRRDVKKTLRERGLLWRRSLRIERSAPAERVLSLSAAKIDACVAIHRAERSARGDSLRQVFLTDYIRDEALDAEPGTSLADLGALPVFDALAASGPRHDIGMLSGRLAIVHESRVSELRERLPEPSHLRTPPLAHRPGWLRAEGVPSGALVAAFTGLLQDGSLHVIVGTRSLLGEGWDAPAVNSLVLASFVGAFVSTNQMRGRAIRRDPRTREKVSSVWHLVAVAPDTPTGYLDYEQLSDRFRTFVGLSADGRVIESGIGRLDLPPLGTVEDLGPFNAASLQRLERLDEVAEGWRRAVEGASTGQVIPTTSFRRAPSVRSTVLSNTLRYLAYETAFAGALTLGEVLRRLSVGGGGLGITVIVGAAIPLALFAPKLFHTLKLAALHAPVRGSVSQIGRALLEALRAVGMVEDPDVRVRSGPSPGGGVYVSLNGGSFYEQALFADALGEILGPVENPRYLITRRLNEIVGERVDYHAVPHQLGAKREFADAFLAAWVRHVGPAELVYTRREGGREALLAARARAFSNQFVDPAERLDRWQ